MGAIGGCIWYLAGMYGEFQRMIEILVRIELRGIWGQEEHLNLVPMLFQPFRSEFSVMDFQVVQNEKHLLPGRANQTTHKFDEPLLIHRVLVEHKANPTLIADG